MKYVGENALKKWTSLVKSDIKKKLDKNQGTANSGKILGVDASGEVAPTDTEVATLVNIPNGIVKGDGNTLSAAVAGIDYQAPLEAGIDYQAPLEDWDNAMLLKNGWARATLPADMRWHSVCYGNGMFVAVADGKDIYGGNIAAYSTDGINWIKTTLPANAKWQSVCYGNGKFVAVAFLSSIAAYSIDGINWTQSTLPADSSWYSICYGNGKFVAISGLNKNIAAYSTDGINWTKTTLPTSAQWNQLCYGNGMFVTVAVGTIAAYSTDGINWTQSTLPDSKNWNSVCYGDGKFVAMPYKDTNGAYSTDGINWTQMRVPTGTSICYGDDKFMIVSYGQANTWYSTDGTHWTPATMPVGADWTSLCYGGDKFVTVGYDSNIAAYFTFSVFNPAGADATGELKTVLRMNEAIAEAKPFIVTMNENNTTNKTVTEIKAAYDAGRTCVLAYSTDLFALVVVNDKIAAFSTAIVTEVSPTNLTRVVTVIVTNGNRATVKSTDCQNMITVTGLLKGDGNGGVSAAVAGTDYMAPVTGGTAGQVLTKTTDGQEWKDREKDLFVVTISGDDSSGYTVNKTFSEIKAAYDEGKTVVAITVVNSMICPLFLGYIADEWVQFTAALFDNMSATLSITMDKNNNIARELTYNQVVITASGLLKGDGIGGVSAATAGTDYMVPPTGGTAGQVLTKTANSSEWADAPKSLPDGGIVGDALVKSTDGGSWETPVEASLVDLPVITASQTDLTAGTSPLATGELYVVYE